MKYKELTTKSEGEIKRMLEELREGAEVLATKIRLNQEKQTHKLRQIKKDIARIMTYLYSKESKS